MAKAGEPGVNLTAWGGVADALTLLLRGDGREDLQLVVPCVGAAVVVTAGAGGGAAYTGVFTLPGVEGGGGREEITHLRNKATRHLTRPLNCAFTSGY